jgi:hypothetical protein
MVFPRSISSEPDGDLVALANQRDNRDYQECSLRVVSDAFAIVEGVPPTCVSPPIQATGGLGAFATGRFGAASSEPRMSLKGRYRQRMTATDTVAGRDARQQLWMKADGEMPRQSVPFRKPIPNG